MHQVRSATHADLPTICEFQVAMAKETEDLDLSSKTLERGIGAVFTDPSKGQYFVAEADGRIISSLLITYEWSDWRNGMVWWIQSVYVRPEYRGKGVYRTMYEHVKNIVAQDSMISGLRLYVDLTNTNAQEVYHKLGMNGDHYKLFEWMKS